MMEFRRSLVVWPKARAHSGNWKYVAVIAFQDGLSQLLRSGRGAHATRAMRPSASILSISAMGTSRRRAIMVLSIRRSRGHGELIRRATPTGRRPGAA